MRLLQRTEIRRPAMTVWEHVIRPERFQKWNKKIAEMEARGAFRVGQPFATRYKWKGRQIQCLSVATSIVEGSLLELRHSSFVGDKVNPGMEVIERITLTERHRRTVVTKELSINKHGIPLIWAPIVWFIARFGWRAEPDALKAICESEV
jgi:uncharacterized protein YndB with AHSA1/START domain